MNDTGESPATVLYVHSSDDLYGADVILLQIVSGLDRRRFTPLVILPDDMSHVGLLSAELASRGIEFLHLPIAVVRRRYLRPRGILPFLMRLVRGTLAIRRIARERNVRLVHGFTFAVAAAPLAARVLGLPLVMHAHEIILRPKKFRKLLHAYDVRWAQRVLCVSDATRRNIVEDQPDAAARIQTIHNGIEISAPRSRPSEMRDRLGVPQDRPLVGMIGRISPWKGQDVFLRAAALILAERPDCHFVLIGGVFDKEIQYLDRLNALRRELRLENDVTLCGFMKNAREAIPAFDVFVLPSTLPDPFPTVLLEAMSVGVPVIASAHGGPPEMIVEGKTGLLVRPGDPGALAASVHQLLADPALRRRMGDAGKERVSLHFEVSRYVDQIQEVYDKVLAARTDLNLGDKEQITDC